MKKESIMPEMVFNVPIAKVANIINGMNKQELETLLLLLTKDGAELLQRNNDLKLNKTQYLTEEEVFDV